MQTRKIVRPKTVQNSQKLAKSDAKVDDSLLAPRRQRKTPGAGAMFAVKSLAPRR